MITNKSIDTLRDRGLRLTRPRRIILDVVRATDAHPTAAFVYRRVRRRLPRVSLATVYRNLRMLAAEGFLAERADAAGMRFDGNTGPHDHFTCLACGRIYDVPARAERAAPGAHRLRGPRSSHRVLRPLRRLPPVGESIVTHPSGCHLSKEE
jgi:Fe2+ or Zn2+ uptake regulation protein